MHPPSPPRRATFTLHRFLLSFGLSFALLLFGVDRYAAYAHRPGPTSTEVTIYTTVWCGYCKRLRQDLQASKIPYAEYDVEKSMQGLLGMWALRARGVPVSVIGPQIVHGYQLPAIETALAALGHRYTPAGPADSP